MKRIVRKTMGYTLILAIVVLSFRLYMISSKDEMFIATNIAMFIVFIPIAYKKIFKK